MPVMMTTIIEDRLDGLQCRFIAVVQFIEIHVFAIVWFPNLNFEHHNYRITPTPHTSRPMTGSPSSINETGSFNSRSFNY